jgi:predicted Zn-dependent protease
MKRWITFAAVVTLGIAALVWSERHQVDVRVTPASLLYFIADSEWELSRLPIAATRMSDQEEIDIGNQLATLYSRDSFRNLPPEQQRQAQLVAEYVDRVGGRVAARAHRKLPYTFQYVPDMNFVNAFALPGGHVFIGAGLIALMDSEDELAAVLGHEIEHIDHYHCAERVQTEQRLRRIPLGSLMGIPVALFEAGYSKDQELQADAEGTKLAVWAGYSPLGAVRMFETFDRLYQEYVRRAQSPQEELSTVAIQTIEGYFRSHPLPAERIAQIHKLINDEHWVDLMSERNLEVAYIFWTDRARQAYDAGHYDVAARLAQQSLKMVPDQQMALMVLGQAEFAQADFSEAAATFRKALDLTPKDWQLVVTYCDALVARHTPAESLREYTTWLALHPESKGGAEVGLHVVLELGRLTLAAKGDAAADKVLFPTVSANAASLPPVYRGRYGWWFYEVGEYGSAAKWLQSAVEELPGDPALQTLLGWTLIEQHNLEGAMQRFESAGTQYPSSDYGSSNLLHRVINERRMGLAVAKWQAQQHDSALSEFSSVTYAQPEWLNPKWVESLYSPGVAKTIEEMKAEQKKRYGHRTVKID